MEIDFIQTTTGYNHGGTWNGQWGGQCDGQWGCPWGGYNYYGKHFVASNKK